MIRRPDVIDKPNSLVIDLNDESLGAHWLSPKGKRMAREKLSGLSRSTSDRPTLRSRAMTKDAVTCGLGAEVRKTEKGEVIELRAFSGALVRRIYLYSTRATDHDYARGVQASWYSVPVVTKSKKK